MQEAPEIQPGTRFGRHIATLILQVMVAEGLAIQ